MTHVKMGGGVQVLLLPLMSGFGTATPENWFCHRPVLRRFARVPSTVAGSNHRIFSRRPDSSITRADCGNTSLRYWLGRQRSLVATSAASFVHQSLPLHHAAALEGCSMFQSWCRKTVSGGLICTSPQRKSARAAWKFPIDTRFGNCRLSGNGAGAIQQSGGTRFRSAHLALSGSGSAPRQQTGAALASRGTEESWS